MATGTVKGRKARSLRRRHRAVRSTPEEAASAAQLRYVSAAAPGIRRLGAASRFHYRSPDGTRVTERATLQRIRQLAVPPAWSDVWICASANGHLQATGRDARGRKQYRYHTRWREVRDEDKFSRLLDFGEALSKIRERVDADMSAPGFPREKVIATIVRLLETTFVRVGNESYARANGSFGLTTLQNRHVRQARSGLRLRFRGKSGVQHDVVVTDRRLARLVRRCRDLPGQDLFQYLDADGDPQPVTSTDVNEYLKTAAGANFTAKDFRTWAGTLLALRYVADNSGELEGTAPKAFAIALVKDVASALGNTPAVCRKCYIHPAVLSAANDPESYARICSLTASSPHSSGDAKWEDVLQRFMHATTGS